MDKAGKRYWDRVWEESPGVAIVNPREPGLNNYINREFHQFFARAFRSIDTRNAKILEIGCARSAWLPYFSKEFGFSVSGIDYSEGGVQQAKELLVSNQVEGTIYCVDAFHPPPELLGSFDVVVSFGVVEHFEKTAECINAFARFLKPGGLIITNIPNLTGFVGFLQKVLNPKVYAIHVPLTRELLSDAHIKAGLELRESEYFAIANFSVINVENFRPSWRYHVITRICSWLSKAMWVGNRVIPVIHSNRLTSPHINCIAQRRIQAD